MFTSADAAAVTAVILNEIIGDRAQSVTLRRGETTVATQEFRVERIGGRSNEQDGAYADQTEQALLIIGAADADIEIGDRFNLPTGELVLVKFIRPNRQTHTQAEGEIQT